MNSSPSGDLPAVFATAMVIIYLVWFLVAVRNRKGD